MSMRTSHDSGASYQRLDNGKPTHGDDPMRGVWYSADSRCGYWTDDWQKVANGDGIPCCPVCSCPGMQTTAKDWIDGCIRFEKEGHPRYVQYVLSRKEDCAKIDGVLWMESYRTFADDKSKGCD